MLVLSHMLMMTIWTAAAQANPGYVVEGWAIVDNSARRGGINGCDDTFAFLSARRNDKCANLRTQTGPFAFLSAHNRRFGANLGTQTISGVERTGTGR